MSQGEKEEWRARNKGLMDNLQELSIANEELQQHLDECRAGIGGSGAAQTNKVCRWQELFACNALYTAPLTNVDAACQDAERAQAELAEAVEARANLNAQLAKVKVRVATPAHVP